METESLDGASDEIVRLDCGGYVPDGRWPHASVALLVYFVPYCLDNCF